MYHVQLKAEGNDHIERALPHHRVIEVSIAPAMAGQCRPVVSALRGRVVNPNSASFRVASEEGLFLGLVFLCTCVVMCMCVGVCTCEDVCGSHRLT